MQTKNINSFPFFIGKIAGDNSIFRGEM